MATKTLTSDFAQRPAAGARGFLSELNLTIPRRGQWRLVHKLVVLFMLLSLAPLLLAGFALIGEGERYIQKEVVGVKIGIAQRVASNINSYIDDKRNLLQIIHKSGDFLSMDSNRQAEALSNVMNAYPMFMRMTVLDLDGNVVSSVNRLGNVNSAKMAAEERDALRSIRSFGGEYRGPISRSPEGYPQLLLGVAIERIPGRPIGVLLGALNLIDLSSLVKDIVIDEHGYAYVVSTDPWQMIAHPDVHSLVGNNQPSEIRALEALRRDHPEAFEGVRAENGAIEIEDEAGKFLSTYATVKGLNWKVFVQQPVAEAYRASRHMREKILIALLGVFIVTLLIGWRVSKAIVARVDTLQQAIERVGEGHFDVAEVPESNDEFGALTRRFMWMAQSLKDKTLKLMSAQKELQRWNSDLERRVQERIRELKEAQDQLVAQEKLAALGQMASVVGHELRNPLAVMNNSVYFLKTKLKVGAEEAQVDPKIEKHLNIIESEIGKSNTIIRDVLDFARNRALIAAPHRIDDLVEKAIERIQLPPDVTLAKDLTLGAAEALVDEDELRQVLVNLMENACQAMVKGGTLSVGTKAQGDAVDILIGDSGCGIPQEHLAKIFAPFFTTKSRGTGLGLAVVKKIIDRHQGSIDVQSKVGEGTQFRIRLPRAQSPAVVPPVGGTNG